MGKHKYTQEERAAVNAKRALLMEAAKIAGENRPADVEKAAQILSGYSRRNVALILVQAENAGRDLPQAVAGFHAWRAAGRMVRKGCKGYFIYAPVVKKNAEGETEKQGFTVTHVFDVADTDEMTEDSPKTLRELVTQ